MPRFSTLISSSTLRVAGAVAALAVTAPLSLPSSAAPGIEQLPCAKDRIVKGSGTEWQSFPGPRFEAGIGMDEAGQDITAYAVSPASSKFLVVTNGNAVYRSRDGGCTWSLSFRLDRVPADPSIPLSGMLTTIKFLHVSANGTIFAVAEELETGATVGRPRVLRSSNGEINSWTLADNGLPPLGTPLALRTHRTNPSVAYLTFRGAREESTQCPPAPLPCPAGNQQGDRLGLMYGTTNAGTTWTSRTDPNDLDAVAAIKYLSVEDDDRSGNTVWVVANGLLQKSTDGGRTFDPPDGLLQEEDFEFTAVESLANTPASEGLALVGFSAAGEMVRLERGKWITTEAPFGSAVDSIAQRPEGDIAVSTAPFNRAPAQIWRIFPRDFIDFTYGRGLGGKVFRRTFGWEYLTPPEGGIDVPAAVNAGAARGAEGTFYVRDRRRVLRFLGSVARVPDTSAPPTIVGPPPITRGSIDGPSEVNLKMGETKSFPYTLKLPPSPTPIDVYLLVDNSGSMHPTIEALKADLGHVAQSLHSAGIDVAMGVGQINVEPEKQSLPIDDPRTKDVDESKPRPIYQRLYPVGPVRKELFDALSKIDGNGGNGKEAQLEALYQAVTGDGVSYQNLGWLVGYQVPKGQHAGFRDALSPIKVIVHATDEEFSQDLAVGHNDFESVARALNQNGVRQIGLSQGVDEAAADLRRMAQLTGAVAPKGGTDCDGDGVIGPDDVRGGKPLVCGQSYGLDKTLVNLIRALSDRQTISITGSRSPTLASISDLQFNVDAKKSTHQTFRVTYSCRNLGQGDYVNNLTAALRNLVVATKSTTVNCGGKLPGRSPQLPGVEPAAPPPPPQPQPLVPGPVPLNPVPQPQAQPQVQTQVNPQAGMADQEEQQFQLALAEMESEREQLQGGDQLAMTAMSYADNPAVVLSFGMAMAGAAGAAVALRRRSRTASAKVTVRR